MTVYRQLQIGQGRRPEHMCGKAGFASRLLAIPLYDLNRTSKPPWGMVIPCRMQNFKSVAALGEAPGGNTSKWKTTSFRKSCFLLGRLALRCSLAVTWLTVYRQLQVPAQGRSASQDARNIAPKSGSLTSSFSKSLCEIVVSVCSSIDTCMILILTKGRVD